MQFSYPLKDYHVSIYKVNYTLWYFLGLYQPFRLLDFTAFQMLAASPPHMTMIPINIITMAVLLISRPLLRLESMFLYPNPSLPT